VEIAQDLRSYQELGALEKTIQQATQQLAILNMVNNKNKPLQNWLIYRKWEDETTKLVKLVGRWNSTGVGIGVGQGNGEFNLKDFKLDDKLNCVV